MHYDYLVVGAGLFGAVFSCEMNKVGKKCLVIDKRNHVAGNIRTKSVRGIQVHLYGAHIFHTSSKEIWDYVNQFTFFNHFINSPLAVYQDQLYNLPFNMNTFHKLWGVKTPAMAKEIIDKQIKECAVAEPANLEEQAITLAGTDVYEKLIKGYTEKQWGRKCTELPAFIINRVPFRYTYDNNYFTDPYQGIPVGGYTAVIEKMLEGIEVWNGMEYKTFRSNSHGQVTYDKILYTGMIDEYFDYCFGALEYRSLSFEQEYLADCDNYQGNAVVNYTEKEVPYTRIIEHKHFEFGTQEGTVITKEYPMTWKPGEEPYYPVNDKKNNCLYQKYKELAQKENKVLFGGRLGQYQYFDMDKTIASALELIKKELN